MDINVLKARSLKLAEIRREANKKYQASKDHTEVVCGCGSKFKACNKYQHYICIKHVKWLENQQPAEQPAGQPAEEFTNYIVGEPNELKKAEDKIVELGLALIRRDNKLNRLRSVLGDCKSIDTVTIKQLTELCELMFELN